MNDIQRKQNDENEPQNSITFHLGLKTCRNFLESNKFGGGRMTETRLITVWIKTLFNKH